jgi:hypothetical protein
MHSDDPAASAALATKGNIDAQGPQERVRPPQPAGHVPGDFWASRAAHGNIVAAAIGAGPYAIRLLDSGRKTASFDSYRSLTATGLTLGYFASYFRRGPEHSRERNVK